MAASGISTKCDICYQTKMLCACPKPMARRVDPADAAAAEQQLKSYKIQHTKELATLTSMGFPEDASVEALLQTQGNVEKAANYLVLKQAQQERAQLQLAKQRGSQSNLLGNQPPNNSLSRLADPRFKTQPYASVDHSHAHAPSKPAVDASVSGANSGGRMQPPVILGAVFAVNDWVKFTHDSRTLVGQVTDTKLGNENRLWCQVQSSDLPSNMKWIQADSLSLYQPDPSPAPLSPRRPPAVTIPVQSPSKSVKPAVSPSAPPAKSPANAPSSSSKDSFVIDVETYVDVRDSVGKWLEAQVVKKNNSSVLIHFLRWDEKWDEWLDLEKDRARFAPFHTYSAGGVNPDFAVETHVWVRPSVLNITAFVPGFVRKVDGPQVQVQFEYDNRRYQAWFHVKSEEIHLNEPNWEAPPPPPPEEEAVEKTKTADGKWFKGQYVEVLDTVGKWLPAEVMQVSNDDRLLIHYENWSSKWDEWLHPVTNASRLRSLGADIQESPEEALKKEEDEKFRKSMKEKGLIIFDCEKDGNCLFRAVAHQVYGDPELHEQVRLACYSYMERDRDYFSQYLGEDFDTYVQRQKQLMQWGDQPELMAMREMYNKELELYQPGKTLVPKPIGGGGNEVKVMRLSFHGRNHYNSVIDPHDPPPLGEGHNVKISFRDLRLAEQTRERAAAKQRQADQEEKGAPPVTQRQPSYYDTVGRASRSSSNHSHGSMLRAVDSTPQLQKADFDELWYHYDPSSSGTLRVQEVEKILNKLFELLHRRLQALLRTQGDFQKIESLNKTYDDEKGNLRDYCSEMLTPTIDPTTRLPLVSYPKAREVFLSVVAPRLQWALGKL